MHSAPGTASRQGIKAQIDHTANKLPFSPLPRALLRDRSLRPLDKVIAGLILPWLLRDATGWVLNDVLVEESGACLRSVQNSIGRLAKAGWFAFEEDPRRFHHRKITALWRTDEGLATIQDRLARQVASDETPQNGAGSTMHAGAPKEEGFEKEEDQEINGLLKLRDENQNTRLGSSSKRPLIDPRAASRFEVPTIHAPVSPSHRRKIERLLTKIPPAGEEELCHRWTLRFAKLTCDATWDDRATNLGCHRKFANQIVEGTLSSTRILDCLDLLRKHYLLGEVRNPPGYVVGMLITGISEEAMDSVEEDASQMSDEDFATIHSSKPVSSYYDASADEPEPF